MFVDVSIIARNDAGTGIQRVVRALWNQLRVLPADGYEVVPVAASAKSRYRRIRTDFLDKPLKRLPLPFGQARVRLGCGDIFLGLDLASHVLPRNRAQLLGWKAEGATIAVIVYDLLPARQPAWFSARACAHFGEWLELVTATADHVVCISESVADDLAAWISEREAASAPRPAISRIRLGGVIGSSVPTTGLPETAPAILDWVKARPTIIMVGTIEPRKGHDQALAAFEQLWQSSDEGSQLLVIGRPGWKTENLQQALTAHPESANRLRWISDATDEFLEQLYAASAGLLVASRGEGFGLPLIEAGMHGKPILARDLPVFREVAPPGTRFFSGDGAMDLADALAAWQAAPSVTRVEPDATNWRRTRDDLLVAIRGFTVL